MSSAAQTMNAAETTVVTNAAPVAPKVATLGELKAAMPGASSDFLLSQLEASATVDAARAAYSADLEKRVKELEAKAATAPIREAAMSSHVGQNADGVPTDWRDPQVQAEFAGDVEAFKAFKRAEAAGAVRN